MNYLGQDTNGSWARVVYSMWYSTRDGHRATTVKYLLWRVSYNGTTRGVDQIYWCDDFSEEVMVRNKFRWGLTKWDYGDCPGMVEICTTGADTTDDWDDSIGGK